MQGGGGGVKGGAPVMGGSSGVIASGVWCGPSKVLKMIWVLQSFIKPNKGEILESTTKRNFNIWIWEREETWSWL
jgi:hypothetical protein